MSRNFRFDRYPYDDVKIYEKGSVTFEPGITVLVGCNGSGKSTLLRIVESKLRAGNIPVMFLNTLSAAGDQCGRALLDGNIQLAAAGLSSSEGEKMMLCIGQFAAKVRNFIRTGKGERSRFADVFGHENPETASNERWILIDSADSGLSIDSLAEVNDFLHLMAEDTEKGSCELYVVISTNQYELAAGNRCINVQTLRPVSVKSYGRYRQIILKSRERKDARTYDEE